MSEESIISAVRQSLRAISHPHFFKTELGFQGELLAELRKRLPRLKTHRGRAVIQQEYQKTRRDHGIRLRPDLLIHEPFDPRHHGDRTQGNYAVFELKRRGTQKQAQDDFRSLCQLMKGLNYPLAFFVNIDSQTTHIAHAPSNMPGRLVAFAVKLIDGRVVLKEERT